MWFVSGTSVGGGTSQRLALTFTVSSLGDFSYDGRSDVFWHNRTTGETLIWLMNMSNVSYAKASITVDPKWRPIL